MNHVEGQGYTIIYYEVTPIQQFQSDVEVEEIRESVFSGNFPLLEDHVGKHSLSLEEIKELLTKKGFTNLLQLESWVAQYGGEVKLSNVTKALSPHTISLEVRRVLQDVSSRIVIPFGFQGQSHEGAGQIHISEQRMEKLNSNFAEKGESPNAMLKRFFENAVLPTACTSSLLIPSYYDIEKFANLVGKIAGSNNQYVSIVLDRERPERIEVITVLYMENKKQMQKDLKLMLRQLKIKTKISGKVLSEKLVEVNVFLSNEGCENVTEEDLLPQQDAQPKKKKKKEKKGPGIKLDNKKLVGMGISPGPLFGQIARVAAQNQDETQIKEQLSAIDGIPPDKIEEIAKMIVEAKKNG